MKTVLKLTAAVLVLTGTGACFVQHDDSSDRLQTLLLLYLVVDNAQSKASSTNPTVRMTNGSGGPESYFIYTNSSCSGTADYEFSNPVSSGNTTSAITVSSGAYYFSIFGVLCTSSTISLEGGFAYTCVSDGGSISCTGTPQ